MRMPWKSDTTLLSAVLALGMTLLGALGSYSYRVLSGQAFSWRTLCLQIIVCLFAGAMMMMIAYHYVWPLEVIGGSCGMAGWSGAAFVKALETRFLNKAGGNQPPTGTSN